MYMCKEAEGKKSKDAFVRMVNAAPFPMMLLAFDYTLDDLVRFCTTPTFSIFGVDPTFNLGNFDVTVTTYHHLLLEYQQNPSGKSPTMIGPIFNSYTERLCYLPFFCFFISRTKAAAFFSTGIFGKCTDGYISKCPTCVIFFAF